MAVQIDMSGRVALVVGGGGGGIGTAVCERLAEAGADVIALSAVAAHVDDTAERVTALGRQCSPQVADVTDFDALRAAIDAGAAEVGPADLVVNVVGGATPEHWHRLDDFPIESFDALLTTNLRYAFIACQHVAASMIARGAPGAMVNISSIASRGQPLLSAYGAAKAGLDSLTRSMAMEWGRHGIRANTLAPGTINTPRSGRDPDEVDPLAEQITLRRRGRPGDIADVALFLLSDLASYVTGQTIDVDGGPSRGALDDSDLPVFVTNEAIRSRFER
ncbi:MAG: SDR family NAD(P)-dependent oxidoreductase [Actinomycetota bacterium]